MGIGRRRGSFMLLVAAARRPHQVNQVAAVFQVYHPLPLYPVVVVDPAVQVRRPYPVHLAQVAYLVQAHQVHDPVVVHPQVGQVLLLHQVYQVPVVDQVPHPQVVYRVVVLVQACPVAVAAQVVRPHPAYPVQVVYRVVVLVQVYQVRLLLRVAVVQVVVAV